MIPYILHVSTLLAIFYIFYWLLLRKETFYKLNRFILVGSLILSLVLPLIHIPPAISLSSFLVEQPQIAAIENENFNFSAVNDPAPSDDYKSEALIQKEELLPFEEKVISSNTSIFATIKSWSISKILWTVYLVGVAIFSLTFLIQFFVILFSRINLNSINDGKFKIYEMSKETPPFSFLNWIFINPALYELEAYNQILQHERIHVEQAHSIDKLLAELIIVLNWFNPFAWLYRKTINNNIEFLTDQEMIRKGTEKESYQLNLLRISVPQHALTLTTNYNESFLKERIGMMNTKKSSARSSWKYLLLLPFIGFAISSLNAVSVPENTEPVPDPLANETYVYSEKENDKKSDTTEKEKINQAPTTKVEEKIKKEKISPSIDQKEFDIKVEENKVIDQQPIVENNFTTTTITKTEKNNHPDLTKEDIDNLEKIGEMFNHFPFHGNEITTTITETVNDALAKEFEGHDIFKGKYKNDLKTSSSCTAKEKKNCETKNLALQKPNAWFAEMVDDEICFYMNNSTINKKNWKVSECYNKNGLGYLPNKKQCKIVVERDPGKIVYKGIFDGGTGVGSFEFIEDNRFISFLKDQNIGSINSDELFLMYLNNTSKDYIKGLKSRGLDVDVKDVLELGVNEIDLYQLDQMIARGENPLSQAKDNSDYNYEYEYNHEPHYKKSCDTPNSKISESYIEEVNKLGYKNISTNKLIEFKNHGVSIEYLTNLKKAGYGSDKINANKVVEFAVHGVQSQFLRDLNSIGYTSEILSGGKVVEFAVHGVNSEYVKNLSKLGYGPDILSPSKLVEFAVHGIMSQYIKELQDLGYNDLSPSKIVEGSIHGLDPSYISKLKSMNIQGLEYNTLIEAMIHNVSTSYIQDVKNKGIKSDDLSDFIQVKIHGIH